MTTPAGDSLTGVLEAVEKRNEALVLHRMAGMSLEALERAEVTMGLLDSELQRALTARRAEQRERKPDPSANAPSVPAEAAAPPPDSRT